MEAGTLGLTSSLGTGDVMKTVDLAASIEGSGSNPIRESGRSHTQVWLDLLESSQERTRFANDLPSALGAWWNVRWQR